MCVEFELFYIIFCLVVNVITLHVVHLHLICSHSIQRFMILLCFSFDLFQMVALTFYDQGITIQTSQ
jgi:hypothetical protein